MTLTKIGPPVLPPPHLPYSRSPLLELLGTTGSGSSRVIRPNITSTRHAPPRHAPNILRSIRRPALQAGGPAGSHIGLSHPNPAWARSPPIAERAGSLLLFPSLPALRCCSFSQGVYCCRYYRAHYSIYSAWARLRHSHATIQPNCVVSIFPVVLHVVFISPVLGGHVVTWYGFVSKSQVLTKKCPNVT